MEVRRGPRRVHLLLEDTRAGALPPSRWKRLREPSVWWRRRQSSPGIGRFAACSTAAGFLRIWVGPSDTHIWKFPFYTSVDYSTLPSVCHAFWSRWLHCKQGWIAATHKPFYCWFNWVWDWLVRWFRGFYAVMCNSNGFSMNETFVFLRGGCFCWWFLEEFVCFVRLNYFCVFVLNLEGCTLWLRKFRQWFLSINAV